MLVEEFFKNYKLAKKDIEHAQAISSLSLDIYRKLKNLFPEFSSLEFKNAEKLIDYSAKLHDIGIIFENSKIGLSHNKIGAKLVLENKITDIEEDENKIVAASIRYHRGQLPKEKHSIYSTCNESEREKILIISSIIRIADALEHHHSGLIENVNIIKDDLNNTLTLKTSVNIMFNVGIKNAFEKKKDFFEKVFKITIRLE